MTLVKWDPWRQVGTLQNRINRIFDETIGKDVGGQQDIPMYNWQPSVDTYATDKNIVIKADLPGVDKDKVSIDVKERILSIRGERAEEKEVKDEHFYRREISTGTFYRAFSLPADIDPDKIKASYKDGVLKVEIPKLEEEAPKKISIDVE